MAATIRRSGPPLAAAAVAERARAVEQGADLGDRPCGAMLRDQQRARQAAVGRADVTGAQEEVRGLVGVTGLELLAVRDTRERVAEVAAAHAVRAGLRGIGGRAAAEVVQRGCTRT